MSNTAAIRRGSVLWLTTTALLTGMNIILSLSIFSIPVPGGHLYFCDTVINVAAVLLDPVAAFVVGGVGCVAFAVVYILRGNIPGAAFAVGAGLAAGGLGLLLFPACNALAKGLTKGIKKLILGFKSLLMGRKGAE